MLLLLSNHVQESCPLSYMTRLKTRKARTRHSLVVVEEKHVQQEETSQGNDWRPDLTRA